MLSLSTVPVTAVYGLEDRNRLAQAVIRDYAVCHAAADVAVGLAGLLIPGGGLATMAASIAGQVPLVYRPMAAKISAIYQAEPDEVTDSIVKVGGVIGAGADIAADLVSDFLGEIAGELVQEVGLAAVPSAIPVFGALFAAGLDATIAATLTWRVGTMVSIYWQNGGEWIGSRRNTYEIARRLVGKMSPVVDDRVSLDGIAKSVPDVMRRQADFVKSMVRTLLAAETPRSAIRNILVGQGIPADLVDIALHALGSL
jgi:uncharacterized protein (DUF697 family)